MLYNFMKLSSRFRAFRSLNPGKKCLEINQSIKLGCQGDMRHHSSQLKKAIGNI